MNKVIITCKVCGKKAEGVSMGFVETARSLGWQYKNGFTCDSCSNPKKEKILFDAKKDK